MANPEHVEIVKKGAKAIAAWREKNPETQLDLAAADLMGIGLHRADLSDAYLLQANMRYAEFACADLSCADLSYADLSGADLKDTNLAHAILNRTTIVNSNLGEAMGLEEVYHFGPCWIGVDTLFRSQGKIPDVFLRGCGVPEELIVQLPSIIGSMQSIQFYSCFISYSSGDDAFAKRLHARMTAEKLRVWFAPKDMRSGKKVAVQIDTAIQMYDRTLLLLSEESMTSEWVRREIKRAREKEKQSGKNVLFPIGLVPFERIEAWECLVVGTGEDLAEKAREYHIPDFSQWKQEDEFEKAFGELMRDLREEAT